MKIIVTAGPTYEPLDRVRRLTNFSTGRLGSELARYFTERGHEVVLLIGEQATWQGEKRASLVETFSTTESLSQKLQAAADANVNAVFHAAAVSDFTFGKIWERTPGDKLVELKADKIPTRAANLLAELVPTPKLIHQLRSWFPNACLVGWKYEMDGGRDEVVRRAVQQIQESKSNFCVANGAAYGSGFGIVDEASRLEHCKTTADLFPALERHL